MKKNTTLLNVVSSFTLQLVTIIYGFIIPKLIIVYFGSKVNGLVASITQLLSYIALVEGGITAVIIAKLYKPLINKDYNLISSIVTTADKFYKKIGVLFIIYSLALSIICPFIYVSNGFNYLYVFSLTIILSINLLIQYMLSLTYRCLLNADKKIYIISFTQIFILILSILFSYISLKIYPNIHFFKLITGILYILQPLIFGLYINKNYKINKKVGINQNLIKDRWSGFGNNLAYFIHTGTDITVLTFMSNLVVVSVYSVYSLVTTGLKSLIGSINNGMFSTIGQLYARNNLQELNKKFDIYEFIYLFIVFSVFTIGAMLITPFIQIYIGSNNTNVSYNQPLFGYLLIIATVLDLSKIPHVNLAYSASKFKNLMIPSFAEAFINISVSIILVYKLGLIGVAIGTIVAMIFRLIFQIIFTKKIIHRDIKVFTKPFILFFIMGIIIVVLNTIIFPYTNISIISWIIRAVIYSIVVFILYLCVSYLVFRKQFMECIKYLKRCL